MACCGKQSEPAQYQGKGQGIPASGSLPRWGWARPRLTAYRPRGKGWWWRALTRKHGVALIMVTFVVSLATILALHLAEATFLKSRAIQLAEKQLRSEYLLKSLLSFGTGLIAADPDTSIDSFSDSWGMFAHGQEVPPQILGLDPGMRCYLQIIPQDAYLPAAVLAFSTSQASGGQGPSLDEKWRDVFRRFFEIALPADLQLADDHLGVFKRSFGPTDMVANLIDYLDIDQKPYASQNYAGVESEQTSAYFRSDQRIDSLKELARVPGFTPGRLRMLAPYLRVSGGAAQININVAPLLVIRALHEDFFRNADLAQQVFTIRNKEPFADIYDLAKRVPGIDPNLANDLQSFVRGGSQSFLIVGKVSFGNDETHYLRAAVSRGSSDRGEWPQVDSLELY